LIKGDETDDHSMFRRFVRTFVAVVVILWAIAFKWASDQRKPVTSMSQALQMSTQASFSGQEGGWYLNRSIDQSQLHALLRACKPLEFAPSNAPTAPAKWKIIAYFKGRKYWPARLSYYPEQHLLRLSDTYYPEQHLLRLSDTDRPTNMWAESTPALDKLLRHAINTSMLERVESARLSVIQKMPDGSKRLDPRGPADRETLPGLLLRDCELLENTPPNAPSEPPKWDLTLEHDDGDVAHIFYYPEKHLLKLRDNPSGEDVWATSSPELDAFLTSLITPRKKQLKKNEGGMAPLAPGQTIGFG
jgi:hypothetical protein